MPDEPPRPGVEVALARFIARSRGTRASRPPRRFLPHRWRLPRCGGAVRRDPCHDRTRISTVGSLPGADRGRAGSSSSVRSGAATTTSLVTVQPKGRQQAVLQRLALPDQHPELSTARRPSRDRPAPLRLSAAGFGSGRSDPSAHRGNGSPLHRRDASGPANRSVPHRRSLRRQLGGVRNGSSASSAPAMKSNCWCSSTAARLGSREVAHNVFAQQSAAFAITARPGGCGQPSRGRSGSRASASSAAGPVGPLTVGSWRSAGLIAWRTAATGPTVVSLGMPVLIRSRESVERRDCDWHLGWRELVGSIEVEVVSGTHASLMLEADNTRELAQRLLAAFAAAWSGPTAIEDRQR